MKYALTNLSSYTTRILHLAKIARLTHRHIRTLQKYITKNGFYKDKNYLVTHFQREKPNRNIVPPVFKKGKNDNFT